MGPDENSYGVLGPLKAYIATDNKGKPIAPFDIDLNNPVGILIDDLKLVEMDDESGCPRTWSFRDSSTYTVTVIPKPYKMSRKHFKKYLMSKGIQRNQAERLCTEIAWSEGELSYHQIYFIQFFKPKLNYLDVFCDITLSRLYK